MSDHIDDDDLHHRLSAARTRAALDAQAANERALRAMEGIKMNPPPRKDEAPGGSTPSQYGLPPGATDLQDLIEYRGMNFALGNIFKACYRRGTCSHSDELRDMRKVLWFAQREVRRLEIEEYNRKLAPGIDVGEEVVDFADVEPMVRVSGVPYSVPASACCNHAAEQERVEMVQPESD